MNPIEEKLVYTSIEKDGIEYRVAKNVETNDVTFTGFGLTSKPLPPKITLPDGITIIHACSLSECPCEEIVLPKSLRKIEDYAFKDSNIKVISIPDEVEVIGKGVFENCKNLSSVKMKQKYIPDYSFKDCKNLKDFNFSDKKEIGASAFAGTGLESIVLGENIEEVGNMAFAECKNLLRAELNYSFDYVPKGAFEKCTKLYDIILSKNIDTVGAFAFAGAGIEELNLTDFKKIEKFAFADCLYLKRAKIHAGTIEQFAISNCTALEELNIAYTEKAIGGTISETDHIKYLKYSAPEKFLNYEIGSLKELEKLDISGTVIESSSTEFGIFENLKEVVFPNTFYMFDDKLFNNSSIQKIIVGNENPHFFFGFSKNTNIKEIVLTNKNVNVHVNENEFKGIKVYMHCKNNLNEDILNSGADIEDLDEVNFRNLNRIMQVI